MSVDIYPIALATAVTIARVLVLIALSIVTGWVLGYIAIKSRWFENVWITLVNVFESIPVIAFFPLVLVVFINGLGGTWGVELASDFLVFDAVVWNVWIGIYQAFKTVPGDLLEVAENYDFGFLRRMADLYIPHSIPRITTNMFSSFADAMFYITVSEVFSVGITTYKSFGIGSVLVAFLRAGNLTGVYYSLLCIAVGVVCVTLVFSRTNRWAVSKFGTNTDIVIRRRTGPLQAYIQREEQYLVRELKTVRHMIHKVRAPPSVPLSNPYERQHLLTKQEVKYIEFAGTIVAIAVLTYVLYSVYLIAASVSAQQWARFLSITPFLVYAMAVDYLRVAAITILSFILAVTVGYYLARHHRISVPVTTAVQIIAAFPAPAYFPLIFIATLPFMENLLPLTYAEVYIFMLGFLSCFYYVFFDFWTGVQGIPAEFWELMRNYRLSTYTRIRYIILPGTLPYLITGLSSTINSAWAGIAIGEFWPNIYGTQTLQTGIGMMRFISLNMANGDVADAAWVSLIFGLVIVVYSIFFTRNLMDLARKKFVVEEGIYAA